MRCAWFNYGIWSKSVSTYIFRLICNILLSVSRKLFCLLIIPLMLLLLLLSLLLLISLSLFSLFLVLLIILMFLSLLSFLLLMSLLLVSLYIYRYPQYYCCYCNHYYCYCDFSSYCCCLHFIIFKSSDHFKYCFDVITSQFFYLRPQADESLLAFLYGKEYQWKINISIPLLILQRKNSVIQWFVNEKNVKK